MDTQRIAVEANRLLPLARDVLRRYPFEVKTIEHLATHSNVMFRVVTEDGLQRVLRVGSPHANTRTNVEYEIAWLAALNKDTSLDLVEPIATGYGGRIVEAKEPGSDQNRSCVLFSWVPGAPVGDGSGTFAYRLLGEMSAALQAHGAKWRPKDPSRMRRWDRIFYYDRGTDPVVIGEGRYDHLFGKPRMGVIRRAAVTAQKAISEEWKANTPQVVHGDLHEWNVHVAGSRLYAFDFEDVMLATPAQDVSVSLYSSRMSGRSSQARAAFRKGYEAIAEWPIADDKQLDSFHASRQIMLMNYAARTLPLREAQEYLDQVMPWLEGFVRLYSET